MLEGLDVTAHDVYIFGEMSIQILNPILNGFSLGIWFGCWLVGIAY